MQMTNAMKMVSASKLSRAEDAITAMSPYAEKLTELLQSLTASGGGINSPYAEKRPVDKVLVVAISSNRGLAGAFNSNIIKRVRRLEEEEFSDKTVELLTIGKKADDVLKKKFAVIWNDTEIFDKLHYDQVGKIAESLMQSFVDKDYDKIMVVYNHFINAATQEVRTEQFLPLIPKEEESASEQDSAGTDYIFEPGKDEIIRDLIPKSLRVQLFKALCDSFAAEHGARMTAMHKATDNATEIRDDLNLEYNKARQASITGEILEISAGAEALND